MVIVVSVALSAIDVVAYEFFEDVGNGCIVDDFVNEGDDINGVESLCEVYCYECCAMWGSFLIEAVYDRVYNGVKGCAG